MTLIEYILIPVITVVLHNIVSGVRRHLQERAAQRKLIEILRKKEEKAARTGSIHFFDINGTNE
jgi:hypothetical protein